MKILIVAMTDSIHTARWVSQISDAGWEIHVFPGILGGIIHPDLKNVIVHDDFLIFDGKAKIKKSSFFKIFLAIPDLIWTLGNKRKFHLRRLEKLVKGIKPDVVHSLDFQKAGYLVLEAMRSNPKRKYKWIATNWGSDIYLFGQLPEHRKKIIEVLKSCDYYSCECNRDIRIGREFGFSKTVLPVLPNSGGFDLEKVKKLRQKGKTSGRRLIVLKGYQGWAGRALVGLRALEKCADLLKGYELAIYSIQPDTGVDFAAHLFSEKYGIKVHLIPLNTPHNEILKLHGKARISIGLSISDAISTLVLEAMAMGSFPIQSNTSCANEWFEDGEGGFLVPPEDPEIIERAIRRALKNDCLVDEAAKINWQVVKDRLDAKKLKKKMTAFYEQVKAG